jgi:hypothetical protein
MKKQIIWSFIGTSAVMITALVLVLVACQKTDESPQPVNSGSLKVYTPPVPCISGTQCADLIAGQFTPVGNVCVTDDGTQLVVTYTADLNYSFTAIHFWYGVNPALIPQNKQHNPQPGQFPYVFSFTTPMTFFSFNVPYPGGLWDCSQPFAIAAHAVFGTETAWGAGTPINPGQGSWGTFSCIQVQCYITQDVCTIYGDNETGWGGTTGGPGNGCQGNGGGGWWFYYDNILGGNQDIWAGQTMDAGYVYYDGTNIVIVLEDGWELRPDLTQTVKIGYYDAIPTCRPTPGGLPIKGNSPIVPVAYHLYYAIHLDLRQCIDL